MRTIKKALSKVADKMQVGAQKTKDFVESDGRTYWKKFDACCCTVRDEKAINGEKTTQSGTSAAGRFIEANSTQASLYSKASFRQGPPDSQMDLRA